MHSAVLHAKLATLSYTPMLTKRLADQCVPHTPCPLSFRVVHQVAQMMSTGIACALLLSFSALFVTDARSLTTVGADRSLLSTGEHHSQRCLFQYRQKMFHSLLAHVCSGIKARAQKEERNTGRSHLADQIAPDHGLIVRGQNFPSLCASETCIEAFAQ